MKSTFNDIFWKSSRIKELEAENELLKNWSQALEEECLALKNMCGAYEEWFGLVSPRPPVADSDWEPRIFGKPADRVLLLVQLDEYGTPEQKKAYAAGVPLEDIFA